MTTRLPVVGSTASSTKFVSVELTGRGRSLFLDGNQKVSGWDPKPNALSLVQIETCPQSTNTCRLVCYVHNLEKAQADLHALYQRNTDTLRAILADEDAAEDWANLLGSWIALMQPEPGFRWHVSGDIMSDDHARWIASVVLSCGLEADDHDLPRVRHWIYTRSFDHVEALLPVAAHRGGDLAINLSVDQDNLGAALALRAQHPGLRLCYLTVGGEVPLELGDDDVIFPDYALRPRQFATLAESPWWATLEPHQRGLVCPVDAHGKDERRRCGPCARCLK